MVGGIRRRTPSPYATYHLPSTRFAPGLDRLGQVVDFEGVAIRAGHHCCQILHSTLDVAGTARASFYIYNTPDEIDVLVRALIGAQEIFGAPLSGKVGGGVAG